MGSHVVVYLRLRVALDRTLRKLPEDVSAGVDALELAGGGVRHQQAGDPVPLKAVEDGAEGLIGSHWREERRLEHRANGRVTDGLETHDASPPVSGSGPTGGAEDHLLP